MKLNIKKVVITVLIVIILVALIVYGFVQPKNENDMATIGNENITEELIEIDNEVRDEITENSKTSNENKKFEWQKDSPENHNIDSNIINSFNDSLISTQITSSIIAKDGVIVNEYFKDGYDKTSTFPIHSCSKSITGCLVGIAIDKGYIDNVDVPISNYFNEISDDMKEVTIRNLLTNSSSMTSTENLWYDWRASDNWLEYIFNKPMVSTPGTSFNYSTGNTHILSAIMQKLTNQTLFEFGKENVFDKIGMDSIECEQDAQGISDGGNGFTITAYDMAKFGLLYLNKGKWQNEQIVSENWIEESTKVQFERNTGTADYGYQWWVRKFGSNNYDAYFAQGHGGQFIFVIPEVNLIITFTSNYSDNSESSMYWQYVNNIVNAVS